MTPPTGPSTQPQLRLALLGGFAASVADTPVLGQGYAKLRGLLARLALAGGHPVQRDLLADLFWPEMDAAAGRQNLRRALFNLKAALGDAGVLLQARRDEVVLVAEGVWLDVHAFEAQPPQGAATLAQLESQASLYRGPLLEGIDIAEPGFNDWLAAERQALHCHALGLLEQLAALHEAQGRPARALPWARRHLELEPWLEAAHRRLMRLHALAGQRAAALAQYEACRRTLADELGVVPDAETEALRTAIETGTLPPPTAPAPLDAAPPVPQRRQVTVLYGELSVQDTPDPEEALERLQGPHGQWLAAIRGHGGHVVHLHGGAVLAYFGYPQAQEHAARHAVEAARAALAPAANGLVLRAGIHTGVVVTSGDPARPDPLGAVSGRAFQLRQLAAPGAILVSPATGEQVAGYFALRSTGVQALAGSADTLEPFEVVAPTGATHRLAASSQLSPFVGRQADLALLGRCWPPAPGAPASAVLLRGEAGVGKSRLVHEWRGRLPPGARAHEMRCFEELQHTALHPVAALLADLCDASPAGPGAASQDDARLRLLPHALEAHLAALDGVAPGSWPALQQMLSLPGAGTPQAGAVGAPQRKAAFDLLARLLARLLHGPDALPALLVVEDAHWLDPSSLEFLDRLLGRPGALLVLLTARPEFEVPWPAGRVAVRDLAPLDGAAIAAIVRARAADLRDDEVEAVVARADGVALFAEEIVRTGAPCGGGEPVPPTLADLLTVRLDRQQEARRTLQLAATLGREFELALLREAAAVPEPTLRAELAALGAAGLVEPGDAGHWRFRHALLREAAYQSQTRAGRRVAHEAAVAALLRLHPGLAAARPELLARHHAGAAHVAEALRCWTLAGQRSLRACANLDAVRQFEAGLALLPELPPGDASARLECALWEGLGVGLHQAEGYGSARAEAAFDRALALASDMGERAGVFRALWGVWHGASSRPGLSGATALARRLLALAEDAGDASLRQQAHWALGNGLFYQGDLAAAREHLERSLALEPADGAQATLDSHGRVTALSALSYLAWTCWLQGQAGAALAHADDALRRAHAHGAPDSLAVTLVFAAVLRGWRGEHATALRLAGEGFEVARAHGMAVPMLTGNMTAGWAAVLLGQREGLPRLEQSVATIRVAMDGITASFLVPLAEAHLRLDDAPAALAVAQEALQLMEAKGDRYYAAAAERVRGGALARLGRAQEAEAALRRSIAVAQAQGAAGLALPAGVALSALLREQGRRDEALRMLVPLSDSVADTDDAPWLAPARALLAALGGAAVR